MGLIFHDLTKFQDAQEIVKKNMVELKDAEEIPLYNATGRISAETIFSNHNLPLFSRSQVDGYALIASDIKGASYDSPVSLKLAGETMEDCYC